MKNEEIVATMIVFEPSLSAAPDVGGWPANPATVLVSRFGSHVGYRVGRDHYAK